LAYKYGWVGYLADRASGQDRGPAARAEQDTTGQIQWGSWLQISRYVTLRLIWSQTVCSGMPFCIS